MKNNLLCKIVCTWEKRRKEREREEGGKSVENAAVGFGGGKPLGIDSATTFNRITPANG